MLLKAVCPSVRPSRVMIQKITSSDFLKLPTATGGLKGRALEEERKNKMDKNSKTDEFSKTKQFRAMVSIDETAERPRNAPCH